MAAGLHPAHHPRVSLRSLPSSPTETFTLEEALAAGYASHEITGAVRSGRWVRVRRSTYAVAAPAGLEPTAAQVHLLRIRGVAAKLGSRCAVSHQSAVLLHGLPVWGVALDEVHVTYLGGDRTSKRRAGVCFHRGRIGVDDVTTVDGLPVTTVARALADMARRTPFESAICSIDEGLRSGRTSGTDIVDAITGVGRLHGVGAARRAATFADGASESVGESRMRVAISELGLPAPVLQQEFRSSSDRVIGRVDFWWPDANVISEFDGLVK